MNRIFDISSRAAHQDDILELIRRELADVEADSWTARLAFAQRACCCAAKPKVAAVMPAQPGRPDPVDLLLCGHHYRVSKASLDAADAKVYGASA